LISLLEIFDQNTTPVNTSKTIPYIARNQNKGFFPFMVYPAINPQRQIGFSLEFMGIEVPVHTGPEMLAKI
jgi:KDO2-lipid IV(A) lauroyltransferase